MNYQNISDFSISELKKIALKLNVDVGGNTKLKMIEIILDQKDYNYERIKKLGDKGKDAIAYLIIDRITDDDFVIKQFRKNKKKSLILEEANIQNEMSKFGISPYIVDVDLERRYIVMQRMTSHLIDLTNKSISISLQKQLLKLLQKMDEKLIFHNDPNPLNFMIKRGKLFVIDFGMSVRIDEKLIKKIGTSKPNVELGLLAIILKLKSIEFPISSYSYLKTKIKNEFLNLIS